MFTKEEIQLAPKVYKILENLGWRWKPKMGEWCIYENNLRLITQVDANYIVRLKKVVWGFDEEWMEKSKVIPILHWEKIEKILEKRDYDLYVDLNETLELYIPPEGHYAKFLNYRDRSIWAEGVGKTRQEAVMQAVVRLGEQLEGITKSFTDNPEKLINNKENKGGIKCQK